MQLNLLEDGRQLDRRGEAVPLQELLRGGHDDPRAIGNAGPGEPRLAAALSVEREGGLTWRAGVNVEVTATP